jgi:hypothetical protein
MHGKLAHLEVLCKQDDLSVLLTAAQTPRDERELADDFGEFDLSDDEDSSSDSGSFFEL